MIDRPLSQGSIAEFLKTFEERHRVPGNTMLHVVCGAGYMAVMIACVCTSVTEICVVAAVVYAFVLLACGGITPVICALSATLVVGVLAVMSVMKFTMPFWGKVAIIVALFSLPELGHKLSGEESMMSASNITPKSFFVDFFWLLPCSLKALLQRARHLERHPQ